jgi:hypothetical protein
MAIARVALNDGRATCSPSREAKRRCHGPTDPGCAAAVGARPAAARPCDLTNGAATTSREAVKPQTWSCARMVQITTGGRNADTHAPGATGYDPPA